MRYFIQTIKALQLFLILLLNSCKMNDIYEDKLVIDSVKIINPKDIGTSRIVKGNLYYWSKNKKKVLFDHRLFYFLYNNPKDENNCILIENQDNYLKFLFVKRPVKRNYIDGSTFIGLKRVDDNINPIMNKKKLKNGNNFIFRFEIYEDDLKINDNDSLIRLHYISKGKKIKSNWFKISKTNFIKGIQ